MRTRIVQLATRRLYATNPKASAAPSSATVSGTVPGLSKNVVNVPSEKVGPGASKATDYKNPEYFCYHNTSYFEAEVEMAKFRLPQPSNRKSK